MGRVKHSRPHRKLKVSESVISEALSASKDDSGRCLVALAVISGMKISMALKVKPSDINWSDKTIRVERGKSKSVAQIPLPDQAREILSDVCKWRRFGDDSTFVSHSYSTARRRVEVIKNGSF
jgi:integrase